MEYEYIMADCAENLGTIANWVFSGKAFVKSNIDDGYSVDPVNWVEIGRTYRRKKPAVDVLLTDVEDIICGIDAGIVELFQNKDIGYIKATEKSKFVISQLIKETGERTYRLKPGCVLPPKKVKKLVDRTPEDFWPLIGKWWCRHRDHQRRLFLIQADNFQAQESYEIAPLGTEEWEPMMKTVECDA